MGDACRTTGKGDAAYSSRIIQGQQGATAVEYGLILALIFLAMVGGAHTVRQPTIEHVEQRFRTTVMRRLNYAAGIKCLATSSTINRGIS